MVDPRKLRATPNLTAVKIGISCRWASPVGGIDGMGGVFCILHASNQIPGRLLLREASSF